MCHEFKAYYTEVFDENITRRKFCHKTIIVCTKENNVIDRLGCTCFKRIIKNI